MHGADQSLTWQIKEESQNAALGKADSRIAGWCVARAMKHLTTKPHKERPPMERFDSTSTTNLHTPHTPPVTSRRSHKVSSKGVQVACAGFSLLPCKHTAILTGSNQELLATRSRSTLGHEIKDDTTIAFFLMTTAAVGKQQRKQPRRVHGFIFYCLDMAGADNGVLGQTLSCAVAV
ncbi:hypothetical protein E2C01_049258 [Portunus trituberculatus]|uniref:Uncharacterized protein n=1 Tax=Portunus trituberculatus TaxID=210409 RepID=A0A5B7GCN2_PORTR|nr:hypothetical protein [Portunus trituberculatus]